MSYKIKIKKKDPYYEKSRRINLITILEEATIATLASNSFAKKFGLLGFDSKIVPLRINGVCLDNPTYFMKISKKNGLKRSSNHEFFNSKAKWDKKEIAIEAHMTFTFKIMSNILKIAIRNSTWEAKLSAIV